MAANDTNDVDFYSVSELTDCDKTHYPLIYALKVYPFKDFYYTVVREAYFVGISVEDDKVTNEVVFLDEDGGEIMVDRDGEFPYNSFPSAGTFLNYEGAKQASREYNQILLKEFSNTHFDFEIEEVKKEIERAYKEEEETVYKGINEGLEKPELFSTTYIKTKYPN